MTTKLTLTMDDAVILSAKDYANRSGKSLSSVVENYLKSLSEKNDDDIAPRVRKMMGVIKLPEDFDYKKELGNALTKKYLK
jgi:Family of unknown function (DUF6364)